MVDYSPAVLDRTFAALADSTRRALLARLSQTDGLSISRLAEPFAMSLPAVMKHLDVLSDAGLVMRNKSGRTVSCRLRAAPMEAANDWLNRYQKFWTERLDQLAAFLEEDFMATATALKPSLTIKRRFKAAPEKVYAAWTDPEKMKCWMGPGQVYAKHIESDPRTGGRYRIVMVASSGEEFDISGEFHEVIANEKLAYTWHGTLAPQHDTLITVTFTPDGDGTLLTLTHEQFPDGAARDSHKGGWNGALDKLETYLDA